MNYKIILTLLSACFALTAMGQNAKTVSTTNETDDVAAVMRMFSGGDVQVQDAYTFDHLVVLHVKEFNGKNKLKTDESINMYLNNEGGNFGMQVDNEGVAQYIIYDLNSGDMLTLINSGSQKMGMSIKLDDEWLKNAGESAEGNGADHDLKFVKTGESKTISGFPCEAYRVEGEGMDKNEKTTLWMTDKLDADWMDAMLKMAGQNKKMMPAGGLPQGYPEGTVIESETLDTRSGKRTVMTVEKVESGNFDISTKGYRFMNMGGMGK